MCETNQAQTSASNEDILNLVKLSYLSKIPELKRSPSKSEQVDRERKSLGACAASAALASDSLLHYAQKSVQWKSPSNNNGNFARNLCFRLILLLILVSLFSLVSTLASEKVVSGGKDEIQSEDITNQRRSIKLKATDQSVSVQTKWGQFRGAILGGTKSGASAAFGVAAFLGIRYASAPIKRLRFMPPTAFHYVPNQVHDAQQFGPICIQRFPFDFVDGQAQMEEVQWKLTKRLLTRATSARWIPLLRRLQARDQSEDCLNLNIYAPLEVISSLSLKQQQQLPVLVVVHGESFDFGAGSAINAESFVRLNGHKLLVVTFNFRLGILGFPPKLPGASRGNLGLLDQVAALHWIKDNVAAFGGSPSNITLLASQKGAIFVNLLMLTPLAKGLFQRAILEDGSALSPLIANQITPSSSQVFSHTNSAAIQYIRLLAKLCDCPAPFQKRPLERFHSVQNNNLNLSSSNLNEFNQRAQINLHQITQASLTDELKTNALVIECLRHKPVEQLMQRIPLDLLYQMDTSQTNTPIGDNEIYIDSKWLNLLAKSLKKAAIVSDVSSSLFQSNINNTTLFQSAHFDLLANFKLTENDTNDNKTQLPINSIVLKKLIDLATKLQLEQLIQVQRKTSQHIDLNSNYNTKNNSDFDSDDLDDLLNAIFMPSSKTARPIFAPVLDKTLLPDEDIAVLMMSPKSPFSQRDLLIGLTQSTYSPFNFKWANFEFGPENLFSEKISAKLEQNGLTSEQAIEMVNVFVRSFYRFHNQEITNSIINHYLSSIGARASRYHHFNHRQYQYQKQNTKTNFNQQDLAGLMRKSTQQQEEDSQADEGKLEREQQQILVLESLLEAFQDALINVPVLRTALIHSTRQLDTLADAFVASQFDRWRQRGDTNSQLLQADFNKNTASNSQTPIAHIEPSSLLGAFIEFAQTLLNDPNWPLELKKANNNKTAQDSSISSSISASPSMDFVQQPKATFLFQFNRSALPELVEQSIHKLIEHDWYIKNPAFYRKFHKMLSSLLIQLQSIKLRHKLSFTCAFDYDDNIGESENLLAHQLYHWLCTKFSWLVGEFVTNGKNLNLLNSDVVTNEETFPLVQERILRFEENCLNDKSGWFNEDHHSVQAMLDTSNSTKETILFNDSCQNELTKMAFDYIISEIVSQNQQTFDEDNIILRNVVRGTNQTHWPVFNLFTQFIATLPSATKSLWQIDHVFRTDHSNILDNQKYLSSSARSSFWSNFVPALNCGRTQPAIPSSLLTNNPLLGTRNSTLLSLNLHFNCQHGSKTALDEIETLISIMQHQINVQIDSWLAQKSQMNAIQNHHTLRMANINQSSNLDDTSDLQDSIYEDLKMQASNINLNSSSSGNTANSNSSNLSDMIVFSGSQENGLSSPKLSTKSTSVVAKYAPLILMISGFILSLTLISSFCVIVRRKKKQHKSETNNTTIQPSDIYSDQNHFEGGASFEIPTTTKLNEEFKSNESQVNQHHQQQQTLTNGKSCSFFEVKDDDSHLASTSQIVEPSGDQNNAKFLCLNSQDDQAVLASTALTLCRSHSSLTSIAGISGNQWPKIGDSHTNSLARVDAQEPIMMPILTPTSQLDFAPTNSLSYNHRLNCQANSSNGNSSSETQIQSSASSTKKRVKISDPLGAAKQESQISGSLTRKTGNLLQQVTKNQASLMKAEVPCPVHSRARQFATMDPNQQQSFNLLGADFGGHAYHHHHNHQNLEHFILGARDQQLGTYYTVTNPPGVPTYACAQMYEYGTTNLNSTLSNLNFTANESSFNSNQTSNFNEEKIGTTRRKF